MIALKSVKTLPATMLEVEREEFSGGGPSLRSRFAAVALERPSLDRRVRHRAPIQ